VCGLFDVKLTPIVYSFGSNNQQDFEKSILQYRPDSRIFTFEIKASNLPKDKDLRITYFNIGLGSSLIGKKNRERGKMMLLHQIMKKLNHTYVDICKIDIEGSEYAWLRAEPLNSFDRIGQILIEVHDYLPSWVQISYTDVQNFMVSLEEKKFRIFHKELNIFGFPCCMEFSLIRFNWNKWNNYDKFLLKWN
jgi:hypothetical protein